MSTKYRLTALIVPLIMILFFIRNVILVETDNLDSWMGGGMRMFGKVDKMLYRVAGMTINYNDSIYFVNFRNIPELEDLDIEARILPNNERLQKIMVKLKDMEWCYNGQAHVIEMASTKCSNPINSEMISEIKVFRTHFNDKSNEVSLKLINSIKNDQANK